MSGPLNSQNFTPRIISFDRVHCAIDYDMANLSMIEVDGGYVAIDSGSHPSIAEQIVPEWDRIAAGPLLGLIYTHAHSDHIGGAAAMALDGVPIWAQRRFFSEIEETQLLPVAYFRRGSRQFGFALPEEQVGTCGIGRPMRSPPGFRPPIRIPNQLFDQTAAFEIGGTKFVLQHAPGETDDHLFVWLPDRRVLFAGDNIYRAFPNLYSIRGVPPRPIRGWIESIDQMRRLCPQPELLILGHTEPIEGAAAIEELLTTYRDAIAYVHDSVLRGINAGKAPDELVETIRLPKHLADHPFLIEQYGTLRASIRGIFGGYMGWLDGQGVNLDPVTDREIAPWIVEELGGIGKVLQRIDGALESGNLRRAIWLSRIASCHDLNNRQVRNAVARVLEEAANCSVNPLERNWRLTESGELRQQIKLGKPQINGDSIDELPALQLLRLLPSRIRPEATSRLKMTIAFEFHDMGQRLALMIRRGVGEVVPEFVGPADLTISCTEIDFKRVFIGREFRPTQPQFWKALKFSVPERGLAGHFRRLLRIARLGKIFIPP